MATGSTIHIQFFGSIRDAAAKVCDDMDLAAGTSVSALMQMLPAHYAPALRDELLDDSVPDGLRDDLMVTVNQAIVNHGQAGETILQPGDTVALFQTFPGGG